MNAGGPAETLLVHGATPRVGAADTVPVFYVLFRLQDYHAVGVYLPRRHPA